VSITDNVRHNAQVYEIYAGLYLQCKHLGEYPLAVWYANVAHDYAKHVVRDAGAFGEALLTHCYDEAQQCEAQRRVDQGAR
jgi:hypothetical protein